MNKLIIRNEVQNLTDEQALEIVCKVVALGKISETGKGKQYCFSTTFDTSLGLLVVYAYKNKNSDAFIISKDESN